MVAGGGGGGFGGGGVVGVVGGGADIGCGGPGARGSEEGEEVVHGERVQVVGSKLKGSIDVWCLFDLYISV